MKEIIDKMYLKEVYNKCLVPSNILANSLVKNTMK